MSDVNPNDMGFTIMELLVVLVIFGLVIAVVATPPRDHRFRLEAAASDIRAAFRIARDRAIATGRDQVVLIDSDMRSIRAPSIGERLLPGTLNVQMRIAEPERVDEARGGIRFFGDGSSTGGELRLRLGGYENTICVNWVSGQIRGGAKCLHKRFTGAAGDAQ